MKRFNPACASCTVMRNSERFAARAGAPQWRRRPAPRRLASLAQAFCGEKATAAVMRRPPRIGNRRETASRRGQRHRAPAGLTAHPLPIASMTTRNSTSAAATTR
jgi:hypothetical protein